MVKETASLSGSHIGKSKGGKSKSRIDACSRMSVRSKESSASSDERATVVKSFCRYLLEFLFTQVKGKEVTLLVLSLPLRLVLVAL